MSPPITFRLCKGLPNEEIPAPALYPIESGSESEPSPSRVRESTVPTREKSHDDAQTRGNIRPPATPCRMAAPGRTAADPALPRGTGAGLRQTAAPAAPHRPRHRTESPCGPGGRALRTLRRELDRRCRLRPESRLVPEPSRGAEDGHSVRQPSPCRHRPVPVTRGGRGGNGPLCPEASRNSPPSVRIHGATGGWWRRVVPRCRTSHPLRASRRRQPCSPLSEARQRVRQRSPAGRRDGRGWRSLALRKGLAPRAEPAAHERHKHGHHHPGPACLPAMARRQHPPPRPPGRRTKERARARSEKGHHWGPLPHRRGRIRHISPSLAALSLTTAACPP